MSEALSRGLGRASAAENASSRWSAIMPLVRDDVQT
jgi:hypothetical protein